MQLNFDPGLPAKPTAGSAEPWHRRILGLLGVDAGPRVVPALRPYSFLTECECPDDCLRDHENE